MTTIAISADGMSIAADGLSMNGWGGVCGLHCKKITHDGGKVYAVSGVMALIEPLVEWYKAGHDPKNTPVCTSDSKWSLIVRDDGQWYLCTSDAPYPDVMELPAAIGTGCDYALGAMYAGATTKEAVEIACRLDSRTGGTIQVVNIAEALGLAPVREAAE
jgi:hypothetical protein